MHPGHLRQVVMVGVTQFKLELVVEVAPLQLLVGVLWERLPQACLVIPLPHDLRGVAQRGGIKGCGTEGQDKGV